MSPLKNDYFSSSSSGAKRNKMKNSGSGSKLFSPDHRCVGKGKY